MELLQCIATLLRGSGHSNCCKALPHCLGVVGSATAVLHHHLPCGQRAMKMHCPEPSGSYATYDSRQPSEAVLLHIGSYV